MKSVVDVDVEVDFKQFERIIFWLESDKHGRGWRYALLNYFAKLSFLI